MGSANLPTKMINGLKEVNKSVELAEDSENEFSVILFTNRKRKMKAMKKVADEFEFKIKNIKEEERVQIGKREVIIYRADLISQNNEEPTSVTVTKKVEETQDDWKDHLLTKEDKELLEEVNPETVDEIIEDLDNIDVEDLAKAIEEDLEKEDENVILEPFHEDVSEIEEVVRDVSNLDIEFSKNNRIDLRDYRVEKIGNYIIRYYTEKDGTKYKKLECLDCGYLSFWYKANTIDRIIKNHENKH